MLQNNTGLGGNTTALKACFKAIRRKQSNRVSLNGSPCDVNMVGLSGKFHDYIGLLWEDDA